MRSHSRHGHSDAYISLPRGPKAKAAPSRFPAGAGLAAAAVGLAWLLAPGRQEAPAPAADAPVLAIPQAEAPPARAAVAPAPSRPREERAAPAFAAPASAAAAVLAFAAPGVLWKWPTQLTGSFTRSLAGGSRAPAAGAGLTIVAQTILSWNPAAAVGQKALYHQVLSDGTQRDRVDSQLELAQPLVPQVDPLVFDLAGAGIKTSSRKVIYGITGTRDDDKLKWLNEVEEGIGLLVFDADKNGVSGRTGLELFGDQTDLDGDGKADGFPDGFAALRAFVDRASAEGVLPKDARARGLLDARALAALERAYGLKMKVGGFNRTPVSLAAAGVREIAFSEAPAEPAREFDGRGNGLALHQDAAFTRVDGTRGIYADLWLTAK